MWKWFTPVKYPQSGSPKRRFNGVKWVLLGFGVLLVAAGTYAYWYYYHHIRLSGETLAATEIALKNGITIEDPKDDFVIMGKNTEKVDPKDNPSPYRLSVFDIKSLTLGADKKYIYCKVTFYDTLPKKTPNVDGDNVLAIGNKLGVVNKEKQLSELFWGFGYQPVIHLPSLNTYYFWGPTGIEWPESARYSHQDQDSKVYGGVGKDYIIGAFPIEKSALEYGKTSSISFMMEAKSDKYTHAAVDVLQGEGKMGGIINWKVGTKEFTVDNASELQKNIQ